MTTEAMEKLRAGVLESLPEIAEIGDAELRRKTVEVHALALSETELERIEDIPEPDEGPGATPLRFGTQAHHYRAVARMALGIADALEGVLGPLGIDRDILLCGALVHDVGKAYEFSPANDRRWRDDPARAGLPAVRHPAYGVHLGLLVGLPEEVLNCIGAHSLPVEGAVVEGSLETTIVKYCDHSSWKILERAWLRQHPPGA
jgi:putative nucleotidyltransferase with HDIG domain